MSFALDQLTSRLNFTPQEQATFDAGRPALARVVQEINNHQADIGAIYALICNTRTQQTVNQILRDYATVGPVAASVLSGTDNVFQDMGAIGAAKDMQSAVQANPNLMKQAQTLFTKLQPVVVALVSAPDAGKGVAALQTVWNAANRHGISAHQIMKTVLQDEDDDDTDDEGDESLVK